MVSYSSWIHGNAMCGRTHIPLPIGLAVVLFVSACSSTVAAHRPLSDSAAAELNQLIEDRQTSITFLQEREQVVQALTPARGLAVQAAAKDACFALPGQRARYGDVCIDTKECECGLTCQRRRCLGDSLKTRGTSNFAEPKPIESKEDMVGRDTTKWVELQALGGKEEWILSAAPTASVKNISFRQHGRGALEGLGIGFLAGMVPGAVAGAVLAGFSERSTCSDAGCFIPAAAIGALFTGAAAGVLLGLPIGAAIGHRTTIEFDDSASPPRPDTNAK
jgi:hypothetical protein